MQYKPYHLRNLDQIEQLNYVDPNIVKNIRLVGTIFPFKTNNYVVEQLIDWKNVPDDPIFRLTFPHPDMLLPEHYDLLFNKFQGDRTDICSNNSIINLIREKLNPHPAKQHAYIPEHKGQLLTGIQHKYRETVLFFPKQGQTCHAYCSFCFRWPQFVETDTPKFEMNDIDLVIDYLNCHPEVQDVLFTGGDPMVMNHKLLHNYLEKTAEEAQYINSIRIGSKSLSYFPYKYQDEEILDIFNNIVDQDIHLAFMAHFNHPKELETEVVQDSIKNILETGAVIRTQSPILNNINNSVEIWKDLWRKQVDLGLIPYYMFQVRNTGAQHYFAVTLDRALEVFQKSYAKVSGLCRTVRGPCLSCWPGKVEVVGKYRIDGKEYFILRFIQCIKPEWVGKIFFAKFDTNAKWLDKLNPAFSDQFFFMKNETKEKYEQDLILQV